MQNMPVSEPSSTVTATQMTSDETTTSYAEAVAPVADSPAPVRQATRPRMGAPMVALAIIMAFIVAIALSRRPSQPVAATAADVQPERLVQSSEFASVPQPAPAPDAAPGAAASVVAPRAVSKAPAKASVLKPKSRITEANGPRAAVTSTAAALNAADSTTSPAASESISSAPAPVSP
jgi:hypothetical protein